MSDISSSESPREEEPLHLELPRAAPPMRSSAKPAVPQAPRKLSTLEDLYATFPVGQGEYFLRVTREAPKNYMGAPIAGILGDIIEPISFSEFRQRFGGGRYSVAVIGPYGQPGLDGNQPMRQLQEIEIGIPGPPAANSFPPIEDPMNQGMYHYTARGGGFPQEDARVAVKRIDVEAREREEQRKMFAAASQAPEHVVRALSAQNDRAVDAVERRASAEAASLREQITLYTGQIAAKDEENKDLRNQLTHQKFESADAVRKAEVELERRLKDMHDVELRGLRDQLSRDVAHERDSAAKQIADLKETHAREMAETHRRHESAMNDASRRYQDDMTRRADDAGKDRERLKETYEQRIGDLKEAFRRDVDQVRADRDREVKSLELSYANTSKFTEKTAEMRIETKESELVRLRAEVESLRTQNAKLLKDSVKDPITYLTEAKTVATEMLGMVPAADVAAAAAESGEFDWKKEGAKSLFAFVQGLPETVGKAAEAVQQMRQQNQQAAAQAQQMEQQQQQYGMLNGAAPGPVQQQQQPQRGGRRRMAPPPSSVWGDGAPPAYAGPVHGADIPYQQPFAPIPQRQQYQQEPLPPPVPQQTQADPNAPPFGYAGPPPGSQVPQQQQGQPQQGQPAPAQQQFTPQQRAQMEAGFERFISELDAAISNDVMPAKMFAAAFVGEVTKPEAAKFLKMLSADQFLAQLDQIGRGGAIVTVEGQQYVRELWAEVARLVQ